MADRSGGLPCHSRRFFLTASTYRATQDVVIKVNGKAQPHIRAQPTSYATVNRNWDEGDKIEVSLPMHLHVSQIPGDQTLQAAMYGPLVLAARLGSQGLSHNRIYGDNGPHTDRLKLQMHEVTTANGDPNSWMRRTSSTELRFETIHQSEPVSAIPLYQLFDERYSVYWKVGVKDT